MNKKVLLPSLFALLILAAPAPVLAGKKEGKANKSETKAVKEAVRHFDTNGDGKLEGEEAEAARKSFAAEPEGPAKSLDADHDGELQDSEITGAQAKPKGEKKKEK